MGSLGNPKTWAPYMNTKDCSKGFCSVYCPQWCYIIFPPPPQFEFANENSTPNFSPLVIAIIGILASAFLLVSYYAIISKFCANMDRSSRNRRDQNHNLGVEFENRGGSNQDRWHGEANGLDEAVIKSIKMYKFKKVDLRDQEHVDCPVCLSEFEEDEMVRLLPKCSHVFHVKCIDMWLRSHSNCPICRASVGFVNVNVEKKVETNGHFAELEEIVIIHDEEQNSSVRGPTEDGDAIIEIKDEGNNQNRRIRRSFSMDCLNMLRIDEGDISKRMNFDIRKCSSQCQRSRVLHSVMSPISMKRSSSSGSFLLSTRRSRVRIVIP